MSVKLTIFFQTINVLIAFPILYWLADMPMEMFRFVMFFLFTILTSLTAQSFGFMMGAMLSMKVSGQLTSRYLRCNA